MTKKRAKKTAAKKPAAKKSRHKKQMDPAKVREEIAGIVKSGAKEITEAVMDQAIHGELAPAKYLFEVAGVYPPVSEGNQTPEEEDCLAKTLLDRIEPPKKAPEPEASEDEEVEIEPEEKQEDPEAPAVPAGTVVV
jgi:hypothetical protein